MKKLIEWLVVKKEPNYDKDLARLDEFRKRGCVLDKYDMKEGRYYEKG